MEGPLKRLPKDTLCSHTERISGKTRIGKEVNGDVTYMEIWEQ